jgi:integrase/recombinase XerD
MGGELVVTPRQAVLEADFGPVDRLTRADTDEQLVDAWLAGLASDHSRRNFAATAGRFLGALNQRGLSLRSLTTIEDLQQILVALTAGRSASTTRQYVLRVKSLLGFAHKLGYCRVNPGVAVKAPKAPRALAKRILGELQVQDLIRRSGSARNRVLYALIYAAGLRVSEVCALNVGDVIARDDKRIQLHVVGKGMKEREVLLPQSLAPVVLALVGQRPSQEALFLSKVGRRLTPRGINYLIKGAAKRAGVTSKVSPHWLRHGHASHALRNGADVVVVSATLGHANVAITSVYLHAEPGTSSGDKLKDAVWAPDEADC